MIFEPDLNGRPEPRGRRYALDATRRGRIVSDLNRIESLRACLSIRPCCGGVSAVGRSTALGAMGGMNVWGIWGRLRDVGRGHRSHPEIRHHGEVTDRLSSAIALRVHREQAS